MPLYKGEDGQYTISIVENNNRIDIQTELSDLKVFVYDSNNVLIQQFSWPAEVDYTDLVSISGNSAVFKIFSSNIADKALGSMKCIRKLKKADTDYPDNTFDDTFIINNFDELKNE